MGDEGIDANGRDRRSENPAVAHAKKERVSLFGTDQRITSGLAVAAAGCFGRRAALDFFVIVFQDFPESSMLTPFHTSPCSRPYPVRDRPARFVRTNDHQVSMDFDEP
jgi:hypothetical protein